jgi:hypothetical protein
MGEIMQAVECAVPGCLHIHAPKQEALVELMLRHSHQAHPEMHLTEQAAEALVDESSYHDKKHSKRSFSDDIADSVSKVPGAGF